jgi:aminoglycoside phosphotransferase (APT) family kinase protein
MARERAILEALAARLSDQPVAIPRYQHYITNPARFALPYGAYRMLLGTALLHRPAHATNALDIAAQLGRFLNALSDAAPLDPPRVYHDDFPANLMEFRRELDEVAAALPEHLRVACTTLLARPIVPMSAQPVFQHGDLGVEHILIDAVHPRVNAIIDWGDAGWGGSGDLAGLWAWGGDAPVTVALSEAGRPLSQEGWARLRLHGAAYAIGSAHYGYKDRRDPLFATALGWLERMYANGQLSDPETPDV